MFWAPRVPSGLVAPLESIKDLELVINEAYAARVRELEAAARKTARDTGNPFFRPVIGAG